MESEQSRAEQSRAEQSRAEQSRAENGQVCRKLKRKSFGAITLEVCLTLPIVVYLMFFCLELIKINITNEALQSICEEATYLTISHDYSSGADLIAKVDAIIEKYRPSFIPQKAAGYNTSQWPVIRWCYETYSDFDNMLSKAPYGGSIVTYPRYEGDNYAKMHAGQSYGVGSTQFIPVLGMECTANPENHRDTCTYMNGDGLPNNRLFVLTVTCNYPFSSSMVKMLFNGGVNTKYITQNGNLYPKKATGKTGTMYILWARGAGIVNAK